MILLIKFRAPSCLGGGGGGGRWAPIKMMGVLLVVIIEYKLAIGSN